MRTTRRCAITALLFLTAACGSAGPGSPTAPSQPTAASSQTPLVRTDFPPLSGPSRTFDFSRELAYRVSDYTRESRFILYDNGAFVLEYQSLQGPGYRGSYTDQNGTVTFEWEGWSVAGPWEATGILKGDSLTVHYNVIMAFTDFEDAEYSLVR